MPMTYDPKDLRVSFDGVEIPMGEVTLKPISTVRASAISAREYGCSVTLTIDRDDATRLAMLVGWHVPWHTRLSLWFRGLFR